MRGKKPWMRYMKKRQKINDMSVSYRILRKLSGNTMRIDFGVDVRHIMVDPAHQRRGIGALLLSQATSWADEQGVPTFIVSSRESYGLYAKSGFETLGKWTIDNGRLAKEVVQLERD